QKLCPGGSGPAAGGSGPRAGARIGKEVRMRNLLWATAALAVIAAGPATAGEGEFKPIGTKSLGVKPSRTAAPPAASTINTVGQTAAGQIEKDGFVKTINNVLGFKKSVPTPTQAGPSALPAPQMFKSTGYGSAIQPVMPTTMPVRR